jgi:lipid-A-disaccharide synthase
MHVPTFKHSLQQAPSGALSFAMVAGEPSGDLLAGLLMKGLTKRWPGAHSFGIGGPRMQAQGFEAWWPYEKLAVRGYVEVLRHYGKIVGIRRELRNRLIEDKPDVFIGVDAPDFNLALAHDLKAQGVPTVHFVCPSIWAWRADRIDNIRKSVDHVLCIFPFEEALLASHGVDATYVGHPIAQAIPMQADQAQARVALGLDIDRTVVALLPGSRASEIDYLADRFAKASRHMLNAQPDLQFVLPAIPALQNRIEGILSQHGMSRHIKVLSGQSHKALAACDVTLIASGTATLEAALFKKPMVIAYNMNWISWQVMKRQKLQPWVGLPNILCQDFVVPELLQEQATPEAMADAVLDWLTKPEKIQSLQQRFVQLHQTLLRDTPELAANAIQKVLSR